MVVPAKRDTPSFTWLACKMVVYTLCFLAFILVAVPYGFHHLGRLVLSRSVHEFLAPGQIQRVLGATLTLGGLAAYLGSSLWLVIVGKGPFVEFDPPKEFVATGPYRWMRNPIAALLIVTVLGEAIFFGSPGILILFLLGLPLAQLQVTRIEEPRLAARFGEAFADYCRRVPRWIPKRPKTHPAGSTEADAE
jgi:protein-S-isoprenylcysteine O-methyltransferase Ste14